MAHGAQMMFIMQTMGKHPAAFLENKVLEVGSLNINGSVRGFFFNPQLYIGCDVGKGPGVDVVCPGEDLTYDEGSFDTVISTEMMEHNPNWVKTLHNMHRMLRKNGLMVTTCAGPGRPEHGTTRSDVGSSPLTVAKGWDYYGNVSTEDIEEQLDLPEMFTEWHLEYNEHSCDTYFWGIKK